MKRLSFPMPKGPFIFSLPLLWLAAMLFCSPALIAQEDEKPEKDTRPIRNTFESIWLIDNQTVMVPVKGTFQMDINHRFGVVTNGYDDFWGLYAPSNIRLGFDYVPVEKLMIGFGFTKERLYWDFNARYAIFQQGRRGGWPVSITYYVNMGLDTRKKDVFPKDTYKGTYRLSYFHQLMIARKFSDGFSLQASVNLSHFNFQEQIPTEDDPEVLQKMNNDHLSISVLARYKFTSAFGVIFNWDQPLTDHEVNTPKANIAFGVELTSSSHAFQIFVGKYKSIVPQLNNMFNQNEDFLIGFNITRLWNF